MEIEVKGHSGCQIDIVREDNELYIYKSTLDKKYFDRLCLQAEKQREATLYEYQHIRVPKILDIKKGDQSVWVKMEYVYSKNFVEYFECAGFEQISYLIKALELFLEKELMQSPMQSLESSIVFDKFDDVCERISLNSLLDNDWVINELIDKTKVILSESLGNTSNQILIPIGKCHGDLTYSNILFNGNNYYLIDFLDSFIETPLLDIVKIRQDSCYLWSQLMYIHDYDAIRLEIISKKIDLEIDKYFLKYSWYRDYYKVFQLINFWRILQYAHDTKVIVYLKQVINTIINEF